MLSRMLKRLKSKAIKVFCFVFHEGFKISNFDVGTAKHLMQASWTELALSTKIGNGTAALQWCIVLVVLKFMMAALGFTYSVKLK